MKIKLKLFAQMREMVKQDEITLETERALSCEQAIIKLQDLFPKLKSLIQQSRFAKNGFLALADSVLEGGDVMAVLPPSSGA